MLVFPSEREGTEAQRGKVAGLPSPGGQVARLGFELPLPGSESLCPFPKVMEQTAPRPPG